MALVRVKPTKPDVLIANEIARHTGQDAERAACFPLRRYRCWIYSEVRVLCISDPS